MAPSSRETGAAPLTLKHAQPMKNSAIHVFAAVCSALLPALLPAAAEPVVPHDIRVDQTTRPTRDIHQDGDTPYGVRIDQVARRQSAEIRPGLSEFTVVRYLGSAHRKLSRNVWLYHNFFADSAEAGARGCNELVLTFADGKLTDLKIVNAAAVKLSAADLRRQHDARRLAGK